MVRSTIDFEVNDRQGVWVVKPLGSVGPQDEDLLTAKLAGLVGGGRARVVVDLSAAPSVDSTTLAVLVCYRQIAQKRGGALLVACPQEHVVRVLHAANLCDMLGVCASLEDAVALAGRSAAG